MASLAWLAIFRLILFLNMGALLAKFQPGVLNPFVVICGCLLYSILAKIVLKVRKTGNEFMVVKT